MQYMLTETSAGLADCCDVVTIETVIHVKCSGCRLQTIPEDLPINTTVLNLHNNNLTVLHNDSFRYLHLLDNLILSSNGLSMISSGAFDGLQNLKYLDLSNNLLDNSSFDIFTFQPLISLLHLDLRQNKFHLKKTYPEHALPCLSNLETLQIDVFEGFRFGTGFLNFTKMTHIDFHHVIQGRLSILNSTFVGLKRAIISHLNLQIPVKQCEIDAFSPFLHLISLTFDSMQTMNIQEVLRTLYGLKNRTMDYLALTGNYFPFISSDYLMKQDFKYLSKICVRKLDLSRNDIRGINKVALLSWSNRHCLEVLNISLNSMKTVHILARLVLFPSITHVYGSYQNFRNSKKRSAIIIVKETFFLPHSLIYLNLSHLTMNGVLPNITVHKGNSLKVLDVSYPLWDPQCSHGRIQGLTHLTQLYISGFDCSNYDPEMFADMPNLTIIEAKKCNLRDLFANNNTLLFQGRYNLSVLDLSANDIKLLSPNVFVDQQFLLKTLILAANKLESLQTHILMELHALETFDVSHNLISKITESDMTILDAYQKQSSKFKLNLFGNPLVCSCEVLDFLEWAGQTNVLYNKDDLSCSTPDGSQMKMTSFLQSFDQFKENCDSQFWLVISLIMSIGLIFMAFVSQMVWRHSVKLRVWCRQPVENEVFPFDVFISYCYEDTTWTARTLVPWLEQKNIEYCIDDKDFEAGLHTCDNIMNAIDNSRKSIFIVSCNYFKNEWQTFTMKLTSVYSFRDGRERMNIIILLNDMKRSEFPKLIRKNWDEISPIIWPDENNCDVCKLNIYRKIFWKKLLKRIEKRNIDVDENAFAEAAL